MKALTLWQPWAWAITNLGKRVENRKWAPPGELVGGRFAIHAGERYDYPGAKWIEENFGVAPPAPVACQRGVIVATAKLVFVDRVFDGDPWFSGPFGWYLSDVLLALDPIKERGRQGLWTITGAAAERLLLGVPAPEWFWEDAERTRWGKRRRS